MDDILKHFWDPDELSRGTLGELGSAQGVLGQPFGFLGEEFGHLGADNQPKLTDYFNLTDYFDYAHYFDASQVVGDAMKEALGY